MSVIRQGNWLSQARADLPFFKALESSVCGDFDLLAGRIMAGKTPLVVSGFKILTTGAITADQLYLEVAEGVLIHYFASESGSIFSVPADRANERLNNTNARIQGSFTPSATNYLGIDLTRVADTTTSDVVMFIDPTTELETPEVVPLGRTLDYRIVISATDFAALPGVCPVAKVVTNASNEIVSVTDARNLFWRLGSGGTSPDPLNKYTFPEGRKENATGDVFAGGDKAVSNMKSWADAVMTRIWELGGGERWTTPTADRNLRLIHSGSPFVSTGEYFEWSGTHAHWKGLKVLFDNSTGSTNAIVDQTTNLSGLTDLADGDCLYVDLDRTQNLSGGSSLVAQKAPLVTLGMSAVPGARVVFAWRSGSQLFTRDQGYSVNSSFKIATVAAQGTVQLSATPFTSPSTPCVAMVETGGTKRAYAGGVTRGGLTGVTDFIGGSGDLTFGGGQRDFNVLLKTSRSQDTVKVSGAEVFALSGTSALEVENIAALLAADNKILRARSFNDVTVQTETAVTIESVGAMGFRNVPLAPLAPTFGTGADATIRQKMFFQTNGMSSPNTRDQLCVMWFDGTVTPIAEGPAY